MRQVENQAFRVRVNAIVRFVFIQNVGILRAVRTTNKTMVTSAKKLGIACEGQQLALTAGRAKYMYPQDKIDYIKGMTDFQLAGILEEGAAHYPPDHPLYYAIPEAVRRLEKHFMEANGPHHRTE